MLASRSAAESRRRLPGRLLLAITAGILLPIAGLIASRIPSGEVVDAASSQRFWSLLYIRALEVEHYDSLATMAQASDTVLVGVVESVRLGRQVGESYPISYAVVTVRPRDILKGPDSELVSLEVVLPSSDRLTALQASLPQEDAIFFLRDKAAEALRLGLPDAEIAAGKGYFRLVSSQGVLRNLNGRIGIPIASEDAFLLQLSGKAFAPIMDEVAKSSKG